MLSIPPGHAHLKEKKGKTGAGFQFLEENR